VTDWRQELLNTLPFERDPNFVGRGAILDAISNSVSNGKHRISLHGIGGIGYVKIPTLLREAGEQLAQGGRLTPEENRKLP
jgi:hypothetical protein